MCSLPRNMFYIHVLFYSHLHSNYQILPCICSLPTFYFLWTTSFWSLNSSFWFIPSWHGGKKSLQVAFCDIYVNNTFLKPWTSESSFLLSWLSQFSWIAPCVTWVHVCTMSQRNALPVTLPYFPLGSWVDSGLRMGWACEASILTSPSFQGRRCWLIQFRKRQLISYCVPAAMRAITSEVKGIKLARFLLSEVSSGVKRASL